MSIRDTLPSFSFYTFGTMSLGRKVADFDDDVSVARAAMETGVWFHTSQEYGHGGTFMTLRHAFDAARHQVPPLMCKIRCDRAETIRFDVHDALRRLGVERIDVAQLCRDAHDHRQIVDDLIAGGPMSAACHELKAQGLVGHFAFEMFPGFPEDARKAIEHDLFDAAILYYNPTQRNAPPAAYDAMQQRDTPILALRTLGKVSTSPAEAAARLEAKGRTEPATQLRELQTVFEQSGAESWPAFCMRFARSVPTVRTTIGGTANIDHLHELVELAQHAKPLAPQIMQKIDGLHQRWSQA